MKNIIENILVTIIVLSLLTIVITGIIWLFNTNINIYLKLIITSAIIFITSVLFSTTIEDSDDSDYI